MLSKIKTLFLLSLLLLTSLSAIDNKIYIDEEELKSSQDAFYIHLGNNVWLETNTLHRDGTGLYTFNTSITSSNSPRTEYVKKWRCPYCHHYWPIGQKCQNSDCPSKYY